jgi:GNAT superfamily N-acetyltransferase
MNIVLRRPAETDTEALDKFFRKTIRNTFRENNINDENEIEAEIDEKNHYISEDFKTDGQACYFIIAEDTDKDLIIGTIAMCEPNDFLLETSDNELKDSTELGTLMIHPEYQRQGISQKLIDEIYKEFRRRGIKEFCFDSGYPIAQKIWSKRFGAPDYRRINQWGEGVDHLVWVRSVPEI